MSIDRHRSYRAHQGQWRRPSFGASVGGWGYGDLRGTTGAATTAAYGEGAERDFHEEQAGGELEARGSRMRRRSAV
eukprot:6882078-Prymnesium_polylepis.1